MHNNILTKQEIEKLTQYLRERDLFLTEVVSKLELLQV
jgi:hypothetical protein